MAHYSSSYPTACRLFSPVTNTSLILDGVGVNVLIADVHATVQISQRFTNPRNFPLDATYTFGLLAGAAICGFKMVRADGTEINGVVKEKEAAKKDYDKAVRKGQTAALGAEETKDVFSISVGNVSANETVTIEFQYVQLLTDDEKRNQIRFMFPRVYAQRYGSAPSINAATAFRAPRQQFTMTVVVQQSSTIKGISCASGHPMQLELGKPEGFEVDSSISDSQLAKVTVSDSSGSLNEDILLVITADGLDNPRCFVEPHPVDDTLAMGLTFVPRFTLPDVSGGMEYIFLVDRSGSMEGNSMKLLREALVVLLRGLPSKGTKFNIVSFGSHATKFWPTSQAYTQANLDSATKHVDSMNADYGGTEIASALNLVYSSLSTPLSQPVAVFLLTDGGAWDVATCVSRTKHAISQQATQENFMRIFTLGIGAGASSNTCDSIAKAGEGFSVYVGSNEPIVGKCARLVRAARTPPVTNLQIFWTGKEPHGESEHDFELVDESGRDAGHASQKSPSGPAPGVVSLFDDKESEIQDVGPPPPVTVSLPPPPHVQQAPLQSPSLFPGTRSQMYCILAKQPKVLPTSLIVRGTVVSTGASVELTVPISTVLQARGSRLAFLHILSAKALISDREHQIHAFPPSISSSFRDDDALRDAYLKADIVRLGVLYGLTSRHTSFVAVD
ncbi:von Willebrand factor type A domain-containing protein, partial [Flagelloscypha sp. PMI_526]